MTKLVLLTVMVLLLCSNALGIDKVLVDVNGNPVSFGQSYSLVNVNSTTSIEVSQKNPQLCNIQARQSGRNENRPPPVIRTSLSITWDSVLYELTKDSAQTLIGMELVNNPKLECSGSPILQMVDNKVQTGGTLGKDLFQIARVDNQVTGIDDKPVYKLQSCPSKVKSCNDIGIVADSISGNSFLGLVDDDTTLGTDIPFYFQFEKNSLP